MTDGPTVIPGFNGSVSARRYELNDAEDWDKLIEKAVNGTFLHTRRFISYHRDRFQDQSLVFVDSAQRIVGVLPAATDPAESNVVLSHPGLTYGGLVHAGDVRAETMIQACEAARRLYLGLGFTRLRYKAVPYVYHRVPSADDLYALFRLGARWYRSDLAATVSSRHRDRVSRVRRRALRRAAEAGLTVQSGRDLLERFWALLEPNLDMRHGVAPVHSLAEITWLSDQFPNDIECVAALHPDGQMDAGAVFFLTPGALHIQYSAPSERGKEIGAVDLLFEHAITSAASGDRGFMTFGVNTTDEGRVLNTPLYYFKSSFGAGSVAHDFYELDLSTELPSI